MKKIYYSHCERSAAIFYRLLRPLCVLAMTTLFLAMISLCYAIDNGGTDFAKANTAYRDGKYDEAITGYEAILTSGFESGPIFYNLANSYFKNKKLGKAIVNYERAQRVMPRDGDLLTNYKFASDAVATRIEPSLNFMDKLYSRHIHFYTVNEMILILAMLLVLLGMFHLYRLYGGWVASRAVMVVLVILFVVFAIGLKLKIDLEKDSSIMVKSASARFEPNDKATIYFELPEGQKVRLQNKEGEWGKIERPDGKIGWVPLASVEKI